MSHLRRLVHEAHRRSHRQVLFLATAFAQEGGPTSGGPSAGDGQGPDDDRVADPFEPRVEAARARVSALSGSPSGTE